jgi:heterodisulfide reductase subunit A-like polyferredoxin
MNRMVFPLLLIMVLFNCTSAKELINKDLNSANKKIETDVLVIGGGTGGTAAGIQSARSGAFDC